jgi:hypothetical protein
LLLCCICFVFAAFIFMFCIFMTYSTSCCCHYKLTDPCNVCMYVWKIELWLGSRRAKFGTKTSVVKGDVWCLCVST